MIVIKKPIPGYPEYDIYSDGQVFSKKRNKFLKPTPLNRGYYGITLYGLAGRRVFSRHRLVCTTFNPVPNMRYLTVDHINGVAGDDYASNLEFVTIKENIRRFYRNGGIRINNRAVCVLFVNTGSVKTYTNVNVCAKYLGLHKDTVLARLHSRFGRLYPDMTAIKYDNDDREFLNYPNPKKLRNSCGHKRSVLFKNIWTGDLIEYESLTKACGSTGVNIGMLSKGLSVNKDLVYNRKYCVRIKYDTTPWVIYTSITDKLIACSRSNNNDKLVVVECVGSEIHIFFRSVDAAKYLGVSPTCFNFRLSKSAKFPYYYLTEYKNKLNKDDVTIHF